MAASSGNEEKDCCWICLDVASPRRPLVRPCKCPRSAHEMCLARWQLRSAGKSEESSCRFCLERLPDWKKTLSVPSGVLASPVIDVLLNGKVQRLKLDLESTDGQRKFKEQLKASLGLPSELDFDISFKVKDPLSGQTIRMDGLDCYQAATHCAAISAAKRRMRKSEPGSRSAKSRPRHSRTASGSKAAPEQTTDTGSSTSKPAAGADASNSEEMSLHSMSAAESGQDGPGPRDADAARSDASTRRASIEDSDQGAVNKRTNSSRSSSSRTEVRRSLSARATQEHKDHNSASRTASEVHLALASSLGATSVHPMLVPCLEEVSRQLRESSASAAGTLARAASTSSVKLVENSAVKASTPRRVSIGLGQNAPTVRKSQEDLARLRVSPCNSDTSVERDVGHKSKITHMSDSVPESAVAVPQSDTATDQKAVVSPVAECSSVDLRSTSQQSNLTGSSTSSGLVHEPWADMPLPQAPTTSTYWNNISSSLTQPMLQLTARSDSLPFRASRDGLAVPARIRISPRTRDAVPAVQRASTAGSLSARANDTHLAPRSHRYASHNAEEEDDVEASVRDALAARVHTASRGALTATPTSCTPGESVGSQVGWKHGSTALAAAGPASSLRFRDRVLQHQPSADSTTITPSRSVDCSSLRGFSNLPIPRLPSQVTSPSQTSSPRIRAVRFRDRNSSSRNGGETNVPFEPEPESSIHVKMLSKEHNTASSSQETMDHNVDSHFHYNAQVLDAESVVLPEAEAGTRGASSRVSGDADPERQSPARQSDGAVVGAFARRSLDMQRRRESNVEADIQQTKRNGSNPAGRSSGSPFVSVERSVQQLTRISGDSKSLTEQPMRGVDIKGGSNRNRSRSSNVGTSGANVRESSVGRGSSGAAVTKCRELLDVGVVANTNARVGEQARSRSLPRNGALRDGPAVTRTLSERHSRGNTPRVHRVAASMERMHDENLNDGVLAGAHKGSRSTSSQRNAVRPDTTQESFTDKHPSMQSMREPAHSESPSIGSQSSQGTDWASEQYSPWAEGSTDAESTPIALAAEIHDVRLINEGKLVQRKYCCSPVKHNSTSKHALGSPLSESITAKDADAVCMDSMSFGMRHSSSAGSLANATGSEGMGGYYKEHEMSDSGSERVIVYTHHTRAMLHSTQALPPMGLLSCVRGMFARPREVGRPVIAVPRPALGRTEANNPATCWRAV